MNMRTAAEMIRFVNGRRTNVPGACQHETWVAYDSHAVGDVDGDGDADAVDGWLSEPKSARHPGERHPLVGSVAAWSGGRKGFGHRAPIVGYNEHDEPLINSTDAGGLGRRAIVPLSWVEKNWGLHYLGTTDTISGQPIKGMWRHEHKPTTPAKEKPMPKPKSRGPKIDHAIKDVSMSKAKPGSVRAKKIKAALAALHDIPFIKTGK